MPRSHSFVGDTLNKHRGCLASPGRGEEDVGRRWTPLDAVGRCLVGVPSAGFLGGSGVEGLGTYDSRMIT